MHLIESTKQMVGHLSNIYRYLSSNLKPTVNVASGRSILINIDQLLLHELELRNRQCNMYVMKKKWKTEGSHFSFFFIPYILSLSSSTANLGMVGFFGMFFTIRQAAYRTSHSVFSLAGYSATVCSCSSAVQVISVDLRDIGNQLFLVGFVAMGYSLMLPT